MPSPYRKPRAQRRGGYDTSRELERPQRKAPPIPVTSWPAPVKRWWRGVWANPVAGEWDPVADLPAVRRLGDLYALQAGPEPLSAATLAQIIKLEQELLLTPAARKRAYVRLPDEEPEHKTITVTDATDPVAARRAARRARLISDDPVDGNYYRRLVGADGPGNGAAERLGPLRPLSHDDVDFDNLRLMEGD